MPTLSPLVQVKSAQTTAGFKFSLTEGATIKGTVTDASTGRPLAKVFLLIDGTGVPPSPTPVSIWRNPFVSSTQSTVTDRQGRYTLYGVPAQRYQLCASVLQLDMYDDAFKPELTLEEGEDRTIDLQLQPARFGTLTGRVFMPDGTPAAGAEIHISGELGIKTVADAQGRYRAERVRVYSNPNTAPSIAARSENAARTSVRVPKMKPEQTLSLDVHLLVGGTIDGRVTRADGSVPKDGTLACLMAAYHSPPEHCYRNVLKPENSDYCFWVRIESDGSYRLEHIPPGKYHLFALSDDKPHNIIKDLNIKDGASVKKDLKLSP